MEVRQDEVQVGSLQIKIIIALNIDDKGGYTVLYKAYDRDHKLVWTTKLLDENGTPETFPSIDIAIDKAKKVFKKG